MPRKKETRGRKAVYTPKQKEKRIKEQQNRWKKEHYKAYTLRFNHVSDQDIIEKLESVENRADYIRNLIRKDMESNSNNG